MYFLKTVHIEKCIIGNFIGDFFFDFSDFFQNSTWNMY